MARRSRSLSRSSGFKQYWNLFLFPPPFARNPIHLFADQYGAVRSPCLLSSVEYFESSDRTFLHSSIIRLWGTPYFNVNPSSLSHRNKVPFACRWRFQCWFCLCSGSLRSSFFLLDWHCFSDVLFNAVRNSDPRYGLILEQWWNFNFNFVSSYWFANFYVRVRILHCFGSTLSHMFARHLEVMRILGMKIDSGRA